MLLRGYQPEGNSTLENISEYAFCKSSKNGGILDLDFEIQLILILRSYLTNICYKLYFFLSFCLDTKGPKSQGFIEILHICMPR